ncbi:ankyrin repeat domain-containing protein [Corynebacterium gerontici]|uniref:Ankyrin repeats (3 copies) n=1 Tax=Corynebacterium gerontici TaxID=2079234 RepID=A0A3G6J4Q8_9CORY|nr:ankyrin repeat domain-containing protein [Corynebacterium gerontici]AZA11928.1 Ankyrin repeats (3 copies) [Corynebacterium gerontici]
MFSSEPDEETQAFASKIFDLARGGDAHTLAQYIDAGVDANLSNHEGNTLLMLAAYSGNEPALDVLIARGANVDALNDRGQSPLAGAIFKKEQGIVEKLIAAGADPNLGHPSALDTARMFGQTELAERLGGHGS